MARAPVSELYRALPLNAEEDIIRLLDIHPGGYEEEVRICLRVVALVPGPYYEALAYSWGTSTKARTIVANDHPRIPVTDNLYGAVRRLRLRSETRTLWVDALCINQADRDEKGQQVGLMARIYQSASCVNIWLGEPRIVCPLNLWPLLLLLDQSLGCGSKGTRQLPRLATKFLNLDGLINSAIRHSSSPWHTRAWVVQEFVLARKLYMCYGRHRRLYDEDWLEEIRPTSITLGSVYSPAIRYLEPPKLRDRKARRWQDLQELLFVMFSGLCATLASAHRVSVVQRIVSPW